MATRALNIYVGEKSERTQEQTASRNTMAA